jgi:mannonate dehydratase
LSRSANAHKISRHHAGHPAVQPKEDTTMKLASVLTPVNDRHLRLAAQSGVEGIVGRFPGFKLEDLAALKKQVEDYGMQLPVIEGYIPYNAAVRGEPTRDQEIENFKTLLANMGKLGVRVLCYNFMPIGDWSRTSVTTPERGGAFVTAFNEKDFDKDTRTNVRQIPADELWANLVYFLERVLPAAEEAGVVLAMHPDDPPMPTLRGHAQVMYDAACYDKLFSALPSSSNAMCFCQGCFAEMGVPIVEAIEHFNKKIAYVHFRDVQGCVPNFRESFHDNGKTDMPAAMRAYRRVGFKGFMRPDHVPTMAGETTENAGYSMLGRLFAYGYIRGLIQSAEG